MFQKDIFNLRRKHILTSPDDHLLDPAGHPDIPPRIHGSQVAGVQPALLVDGFSTRLCIGVVFNHVAVSLHADLTHGIERYHFVFFYTANGHAGLRHGLPDGITDIIN